MESHEKDLRSAVESDEQRCAGNTQPRAMHLACAIDVDGDGPLGQWCGCVEVGGPGVAPDAVAWHDTTVGQRKYDTTREHFSGVAQQRPRRKASLTSASKTF